VDCRFPFKYNLPIDDGPEDVTQIIAVLPTSAVVDIVEEFVPYTANVIPVVVQNALPTKPPFKSAKCAPVAVVLNTRKKVICPLTYPNELDPPELRRIACVLLSIYTELNPFTEFAASVAYDVEPPLALALSVIPVLSVHAKADVPDPETVFASDPSYHIERLEIARGLKGAVTVGNR